jgi:hypothetical protein
MGGEIFRIRPDQCWGLPSLLYNGYRVFPGGKTVRVWRWASTPSSAEVNEWVQLYLYSPSGPSWSVLGWTSPFTLPYPRYSAIFTQRTWKSVNDRNSLLHSISIYPANCGVKTMTLYRSLTVGPHTVDFVFRWVVFYRGQPQIKSQYLYRP